MPDGSAVESGAPALAADIVLPVYGAAEDLRRCLHSLVTHTDLARHRLVVVVDGPQDGAVEDALGPLTGRPPGGQIVVLRNASRRGFAASVNHGLDASTSDVVLLNSDTQVTAGWIDKLLAAGGSTPVDGARVGTVTPFSNHATICSLPRFLAENAVPGGHTVDSFAALVERVSLRAYPRLPTGVGFCLLVRRELLRAVGGFDDRHFGLGYGEEVDLCLRAAAAGFVHLLDDATYVWHRGQGSFGQQRRGRVRRAERLLRRRYPGYVPAVATFIARDPIAPLRARVLAALRPPPPAAPPAPPRRVVHVVHGWPPYAHGGTELYAAWLAHRQAEEREVAVYSRLADPARTSGDAHELQDGALRVRLLVNNFTQRDPLSRNAIHDGRQRRDFARFLDQQRPELVHVHHLAGHCATLLGVARRQGLPVVYQVQDWWSPCARVNLFHRKGFLCSGPGLRKCSACLPLTARAPRRLWNPLLYRLRQAATRRALAAADLLLFGSQFARDSYCRLGWLPPRVPVRVVPYGVAVADRPATRRPARTPGAPVRFGFLGALMPHKGVQVAVEAFARVDPAGAMLEVWGGGVGDPPFVAALRARAGPAVVFKGPFDEGEKEQVLRGLDVLVVPSLGLESFGLAAHEALHLDLPVIASRRGALAELPLDGERGDFVTAGEASELTAAVERWTRRLRTDVPRRGGADVPAAAPVTSMATHAREMSEIYGEVMASRGRR